MAAHKMPARPKQHVSEETSFRLFRQGLPKQWIVRDQRQSDYGIDCEIELVMPHGEVTGRFLKAQVKGREVLSFNRHGYTYVRGIKQSTLQYWLSVSKLAPVIAVITSNRDGRVFFTPTFWQATQLVDTTQSAKALRFDRRLELTRPQGEFSLLLTFFENPHEQVKAHKHLLRRLHQYAYEYLDLCRYDPWVINLNFMLFKELLEHAKVLCKPLVEKELQIFSYDHWVAVSEERWNDRIMNAVAVEAYRALFGVLLPTLVSFHKQVLAGEYYWKAVDLEYFDLVARTSIPIDLDSPNLYDWLQKHSMYDDRV